MTTEYEQKSINRTGKSKSFITIVKDPKYQRFTHSVLCSIGIYRKKILRRSLRSKISNSLVWYNFGEFLNPI